MEHQVIRAAIAAWLRAVPGIGAVYEYERYAKDDRAMRQFYALGDGLLGWHVRRVGRVESGDLNEVKTSWEVRGFMSIADAEASELAFDGLIDQVLAFYRADPTLGGVVLWPALDDVCVPEVTDSGPAFFGGVLCHCVKLRLVTRHVIDDAPQPGH